MKPSENSQSADFDWPGRHDLHSPEIRVVDCRDVNRPNGATGGNQAAQVLLRANTQQTAPLAFDPLGRPWNLNYRNETVLGINVAFAARIPVDVITLV